MKKKLIVGENYLSRKPIPSPTIRWQTEENGFITLLIENQGLFHRIAQTIFKKPKISYVHLDETGSFLWPLLDGETDITALGVLVDKHFGEAAHPLYERLAKYFQILESYGFITWNT